MKGQYNNYKYICSNIRALKYLKQTLTGRKTQLHSNYNRFHIPLSIMDRSTIWKISKRKQRTYTILQTN